jgi:hypothetical protein
MNEFRKWKEVEPSEFYNRLITNTALSNMYTIIESKIYYYDHFCNSLSYESCCRKVINNIRKCNVDITELELDFKVYIRRDKIERLKKGWEYDRCL